MATTISRSTARSTRAAAPTVGLATSPTQSTATTKTYVLDTSVLLSDPRALMRFAEHQVILPIVVITELEEKRHHPELG